MKYYNKTTAIYGIVSVLDSYINLEYFQYKEWEEEYITEWKMKLEHIWNDEYKLKITTISLVRANSWKENDFLASIYQKKKQVVIGDEL